MSEHTNSAHPDIHSRFRGCLLGGAVGDALGYPVEFIDEKEIISRFGDRGICRLEQAGSPALISDDTQMSLFTANGLLWGMTNEGRADIGSIFKAYCEWLETQGTFRQWDRRKKSRMWLRPVPELCALRAPGLTCLRALRTSRYGGSIEEPVNDSKGCGGIMRVAPIGLFSGETNCAVLAAQSAALTHGHVLGWASAAVLAQIIHDIVYEPAASLAATILRSAAKVSSIYPEAEEIEGFIEHICSMADDPEIPDLTGVHRCGEGWVGDEALYIAIFCALRHDKDFGNAIRCAVNHRGDSDSTGSVCGNILGAWLGIEAVEKSFDLGDLELRELVQEIADDLYTAAFMGVPETDKNWNRKYRL